MITTLTNAGALAHLPEKTWKMCQSLQTQLTLSPFEFSSLADSPCDAAVYAMCWHIELEEQTAAECRVLHVSGSGGELIHTLIIPEMPDRLPLFTAFLCKENGGGCMAHVDLATPGMAPSLRDEVSEMSTALAIRHASFLPRTMVAPSWAPDSAGGVLVHQDRGHVCSERLCQVYEDYLNVWLDCFAMLPQQPSCQSNGLMELSKFKQTFEKRAPSQAAVYRLLGKAAASRILDEFICR
jgi:hypothetical protein